MNSIEFSGNSLFLQNLSGQPQRRDSEDSEVTAVIDEVSKEIFSKTHQPRRTSRSHKPSLKLKESLASIKTSTKNERKRTSSSRKRKSERIIISKKQKVVKETHFLHQYPISNPAVDEVLATLDDQRDEIKSLTKAEVNKLERVITVTAETGAYPGVEICALEAGLGKGAFLNLTSPSIPKGSILGMYSGEYKLFQIDHLADADLSYAFELTEIICLDETEHLKFFPNLETYTDNGDYVIYCDALEKGNWTRYLNHADLSANCEAQLVRYKPTNSLGNSIEQWIVLVTASKKINPGEQLLLNYGKNYWKKYGIVPSVVNPRTLMLADDGTVSRK